MSVQYTDFDVQMMQRALALAAKGLYTARPNPAVGCVICQDKKVVAEGWHRKAGEPHAERVALQTAEQSGISVEGGTVYVTLEPCSHFGRTPPCADALIDAKVAKVIVAMQDPNPQVSGSGIERMKKAGIEVQVGLFKKEAETLNAGFVYSMKHQKPLVRVKMAASLDGRTAMENGESKWITGESARLEVHKLRARHGALITGIGTVLADDPGMDVRLPDDLAMSLHLDVPFCNPLRVVLDTHLKMPINAKMLDLPGKTMIMTSQNAVEQNPALIEAFQSKEVEVVPVELVDERLSLDAVLIHLYEKEQIRDVMVEAGAILSGAFLSHKRVNELHVFLAPSLLGDSARAMFSLPLIHTMSDKIKYHYETVKAVGDDIHLVLTPQH